MAMATQHKLATRKQELMIQTSNAYRHVTSAGFHSKTGRTAPQRRWSSTCPAAKLPELPLLDGVRVVLVAPKEPGNIGAAARVCANFEALDLVLVAPRCDPQHDLVGRMACGESVLQRMRVVQVLEEALKDTTGSVGFTRRAGATRTVHSSMQDMLQQFPQSIPAATSIVSSSQGSTALVFGREESGLMEGELRLCSHACAIPTGRYQGSMNLSHAVSVVLAQLFERRLALLGLQDLGLDTWGTLSAKPQGQELAAVSELEALLWKAGQIAELAGVSSKEVQGGGSEGNHGRKRLPLGHLRALLLRAGASAQEVRSLHGLASALLTTLGIGDGRGKLPTGVAQAVQQGQPVRQEEEQL